MKNKLLAQLSHTPYFTLATIKQLTDYSDQSARQLIWRWSKQNHIIRLKNGLYMTTSFKEKHGHKPGFLSMVSTIIQPLSYLSAEFVLQQHQVLTEATYTVTAVTEKNSRSVKNNLADFTFQHIQPKLYTGFTVSEVLGIPIATASKAKALFDYFYFRPVPRKYRSLEISIADELRLQIDDWSKSDIDSFIAFCQLADSPKMTEIATNLQKHLW